MHSLCKISFETKIDVVQLLTGLANEMVHIEAWPQSYEGSIRVYDHGSTLVRLWVP